MWDKPKIAIIGMGFLMSYLKPCYHHVIGDDLSKNIVASTATASTTEKKSKAMGFPVQCGDYFNMLVNFEPDLIFFSPPPSAAKAMAKEILTPYYSKVREEGKVLPDLYAFPPNPDGNFYLETIGKDINVVNILPNMASSLKDRDISQESYTIFNFPENHQWPEDNYKRLDDFFSPIGYTITVPSNLFNTMIGGFVSSHISEEIAIAVSRGLKLALHNVTYSEIAGAMRFHLLNKEGRHINGSLECSLLKDKRLNKVLSHMLDEWISGMINFYSTQSLGEKLGKEIVIPQTDIFLQSAQLLTEEEIEYNNSCHATKGGLLEKALYVYNNNFKESIINIFSSYNEENFDEDLYRLIHCAGFEISKAVSDHSRIFSD